MTFIRLTKPSFTAILIALLATLQFTTAEAARKNKTDTSTNSAAVIRGTDSAKIIEDDDPDNDGLLEARGRLKISDSDRGESSFVAKTTYGSYGYLVITTAGHWYYATENSQNSIQNLTSNDNVKDNLVVSTVDGTTHTVTITIIGEDEPVIAETLATEPATTDSSTTTTEPAITDPVTTEPVATEPVVTEPVVTINSPAVISGTDKGSVTEDLDGNNDGLLDASGKLNISDSDAGEDAFVTATVNSSYGSITIDAAGNWFYGAINTLDAIQNLNTNETLTDRAIVSSIDGTTHTVVITINGVDDTVPGTAAVISGTDTGSVTEDNDPDGDNLLEVSGKLNISDNDEGEAAFIAETVNNSYGSLTIDAAGNWSYAASNSQGAIQDLTGADTLSENYTVSSVDGTTHTVVITIVGTDEANGTVADVALSWVAPAEREDNTAISLAEIAGYKIYYGTTQGSYNNSVDINDGSAQSYTFASMPAGTYYFVITTRDVDGRESQFSSEVVIVI